MEWPWPDKRCVLCLAAEERLSRAHLFPAFLGGFLWSRSHCRDCNNFIGHQVEAAAKRDDSFRYAIEVALADELPHLARTFVESQSYIARAEDGSLIRSTMRRGTHEIRADTSDEGTRTQSTEQARQGIETELRRSGDLSDKDIAAALGRFDAAPEGELTAIVPGLSVRHGSVEAWDLPFDGARVCDSFPAAIAFHFLALRIGPAIYHGIFNPLRAEIRTATSEVKESVVESGLSRRGYAGSFLVGTEQTMPHTVIRVQLFGEFMYRVHLRHLKSSGQLLPCDGLALDIATKSAAHLPAKEGRAEIPLPTGG